MSAGLAFTSPWLLAALVVPAVLAWRVFSPRTSIPGFVAPAASLFDDLPVTFRQRIVLAPALLRLLALALVCLALAGLQFIRSTPHQAARDVALLFDVSGSMLAEDLQPSRLGAAKALAERLVAHAPRDRFAVISFAGEAITDCPLTDDHAAVLDAVRGVEHRPDESGTALGRGLAAAIRTLLTGDNPNRRIVLLTDGAENGGELSPRSAATLAGAKGIVLDAVGVGTGGRTVPYPTPYGVLDVRLDVDEGVLADLAASGGGHYRRLDERAPISAFDDELRPPDSVNHAPVERRVVDLAPACLLLAAAALAGEALLRTSVLRMYA